MSRAPSTAGNRTGRPGPAPACGSSRPRRYSLAVSDALIEAMRRGFDAFAAGDLDAVAAMLGPDFELHDHTAPDLDVQRGPRAFEANIGRVAEVFDDLRYEPQQLVVPSWREALEAAGAAEG